MGNFTWLIANRSQKFFYFFDGNINIITRKHFQESGTLFDNGSRPYSNDFPCCLQIDTEEEWKLLSRLSGNEEYQRFLLLKDTRNEYASSPINGI